MFSKADTFRRLLSPGAQLPVYLLMFVTNRCNAACDHCFYWRELNEKVKEELTLAEFERLAKSLGQMFQVTLTGGSPELRKDLPEIAEIFHRNCRPSNMTFCMLGHATDRIIEQLETILARCKGQRFTLAISLDGLGEEHDKLRKLPGCFDRAVSTIRRAGELKKHFSNLRIAIGTAGSDIVFHDDAPLRFQCRTIDARGGFDLHYPTFERTGQTPENQAC